MPAIAAHYLFGQEVYRRLIYKNRKDIIALLRKNKLDFNVGLQGPDPFFYYKPFKSNEVTEYSKQIHHQSMAPFARHSVEMIRESRDKRALAYMLGFVVHFALDSEVHPLVSFYTADTPGHLKLETELDRLILLREIRRRDAKNREAKYREKHPEYTGYRRVFDGGNQLALYSDAQFYALKPSVQPEKIHRHRFIQYEKGLDMVLGKIYPAINQGQIKKSLDSFIQYNRLMYSPKGLQRSLLYNMESLIHKQGAFSSLCLTPKVFGEYVNQAERLLMVVDRSAELAADLVINYFESVRFGKKLSSRFDRNFE